MKGGISRVLFGLILGGFLGLIDSFCEFLSRNLAAKMFDVLLASTGKGLLCGLIIGLVNFRQRSPLVSVLTGMAIAAGLTYLVVLRTGKELQWSVLLPGTLLGLVVGFATQSFGRQYGTRGGHDCPISGARIGGA
jgi:hypothetical protein